MMIIKVWMMYQLISSAPLGIPCRAGHYRGFSARTGMLIFGIAS